ncbi:MAG: Holliday junction resolvase RuvX [Isosphaera sp.]|nr:Holliday junction resolvase RuvX [Isosphaera sp.]
MTNPPGPSSSPLHPFTPSPLLPNRGVLLGVDFGTVRVGLAVSDPDRIIASPLDTYTRRDAAADAAYFTRVAAEQRGVGLVVGLPLHSDGRESDKSREAREFGAWLGGVTGLPVVFWDERYTTAIAEDALLGAKLNPRKRRERRDRVAAQLILAAYLNAGCPPGGTVVDQGPSPLPPDRPRRKLRPQPNPEPAGGA